MQNICLRRKKHKNIIPNEHSESGDLRTEFLLSRREMRRFLDSFHSLRMTDSAVLTSSPGCLCHREVEGGHKTLPYNQKFYTAFSFSLWTFSLF